MFFCHKELIRLIQNVQNCYKTANQNRPDIEICVAGDLILMMATIDRQIPSNLHTSFVSENAFNDRIKKNTDLPYFFGNQHSRYATDKRVALMYYIGDGLAPYIDEMHPLQSLSQHCHK